MLLGASYTLLFTPIAAALVAIVYRFPIPMVGYGSGPGQAVAAGLGSVFYLVLGGVIPLAVLGGLAGYVAARTASNNARMWLWLLVSAAVIALLGALSLALLEFVIGPW